MAIEINHVSFFYLFHRKELSYHSMHNSSSHTDFGVI